jgi:ketosteroid isomerase-like protein
MSEQNKEICLRFIKTMSVGDAEAAGACLSREIRIVSKGFSKISGERGYDEMMPNIASFKQLMPDGLRPIIKSVTAEENRVAVEFEGDATLNTGEPYRNQYVMVFTVEGGKIKLINEYFCSKLVDEFLLPKLRAGF